MLLGQLREGVGDAGQLGGGLVVLAHLEQEVDRLPEKVEVVEDGDGLRLGQDDTEDDEEMGEGIVEELPVHGRLNVNVKYRRVISNLCLPDDTVVQAGGI